MIDGNIKPDIKPVDFQVECNQLVHALHPFLKELGELVELDAKARKDADIQEVRRIKQRVSDLHELIVSTAAEGKKKLQEFIQPFEDAAEDRKKAAEEELAQRKAAREKFRQEADQRLVELDSDILNAGDVLHVIWSEHHLIVQLQVRTVEELANQINSSLDAA